MPLCFDLDGTLGHFSSGFVLLREALGGLWGQAPTPEELGRCGGSTDWEIVELAFKAETLGIDPAIPRLGSLPRHDRAGLIRRALEGCPGPHLYVGDRPHDLAAAQEAGVPFLGIGGAVPGGHPVLDAAAEADQLVEAVEALLSGP